MTEHKDSAKAGGAHNAPTEKKHGESVFHKRIEATPVRETHPPKK